jgi:hypothetical protein
MRQPAGCMNRSPPKAAPCWSIAASPTPGLAAKLNGVAGLSGGGVWAVGASSANGTNYYANLILPQTLVLQR